MNYKAALEGLLFLSGDEGLSFEQIISILEIDEKKAKEVIKELNDEYKLPDRGIKLEILGNNFKMTTKKEHKVYYEKLVEEEDGVLSQSALETLAIIAYNQPVTRSSIDEIRGVSSSHMVRKLILKGLIEEKGRSELPGRPKLYGTSDEFLDYFGLASIEELPKMETPEESLIEETDLFNSKYKEV